MQEKTCTAVSSCELIGFAAWYHKRHHASVDTSCMRRPVVHERHTCSGGSRCASRLATACEAPACGECTARMMADSIAGGMTGSTPLAPGMDSPTEASRIRPPASPY